MSEFDDCLPACTCSTVRERRGQAGQPPSLYLDYSVECRNIKSLSVCKLVRKIRRLGPPVSFYWLFYNPHTLQPKLENWESSFDNVVANANSITRERYANGAVGAVPDDKVDPIIERTGLQNCKRFWYSRRN